MNPRVLIAAILAFWLAFGPVATVWGQSAGTPCESMKMSHPAADCCGEDMNQAKCLDACLAVSVVFAVFAPQFEISTPVAAPAASPSFRHASILAPPDAAPPRIAVS